MNRRRRSALIATSVVGLLALVSRGSAVENVTAAQPPSENACQADSNAAVTTPVESVSADRFLSSLGINVHIDQGYAPLSYIAPLKYLGVRAIRTGAGQVEGSIALARQAGVKVAIFANGGLISDFTDSANALAAAGALLALEGPNEPNNFPLVYNGQQGGGTGTWLPVAYFQRDVYAAVKADATLRQYPVFGPSEVGAENDNVGLQFITIPADAGTLLRDGTRFADYATLHNYVIGNGNKYTANQAWDAADPTLNGRWDGVYGNNGVTWRKNFLGYDKKELPTLPKVTTETGWPSDRGPDGPITQARLLINTYLAQFKRGFRYTFIYQLRDGEGGEDAFGIFDRDSKPKPAATYVHNLTTILADKVPAEAARQLAYEIANQPPEIHDLLLHRGDGTFAIVLWGERVIGGDDIVVKLGGCRSVTVYDVTDGSTVQKLTQVKEVPLRIADHVLVIDVAE